MASRKRRNVGGPPPGTNYSNPLSRVEESEERNDGGGRRRVAYDDEDDWKKDMYQGATKKRISVKGRNQPTEVLASGIDKGLDDDDVMTIFEKLGFAAKVVSAQLSYDRHGKSTGTAIITFKNATSAHECVKEYDGVLVDDEEMSLKLVGGGGPLKKDDGPKARGGLFGSAFGGGHDEYPRGRGGMRSRGGRRTTDRSNGSGMYSRRGGGEYNNRRDGRSRGSRGGRSSRGSRGGRGGRRSRGGSRTARSSTEPKSKASAADLDKEMDEYRKKAGKADLKKDDLDAELEAYKKKAGKKKSTEEAGDDAE